MTQGGLNGNNNNPNYGNYGNYDDYGQHEEKSNANNNHFNIDDNSDEGITLKMVSTIGMTDNYGGSQSGSVNKSVAALENMQDEDDNNYGGSFKPNNCDNYPFRYGESSRSFVNSEGYSFHLLNSHSNVHSQSSNSNNNTSYT